MTFPVEIPVFGFSLHPHPVFELAGYAASFTIYAVSRSKFPRAVSAGIAPLWIAVGALAGALVGAKLLGWLEWIGGMPEAYANLPPHDDHHMFALLGGKTVVGGLLGGWAGVEIAKRITGVRHSTGDVYVFPLIVGMAVGRVGCFLTGLEDMTHGVATVLPWAIDFGDGVPRHPTQLYDIAFLLLVGLVFRALRLRAARARDPSVIVTHDHAWPNGVMFRGFFALYFGYRFVIEFLKPRNEQLGPLSAIQIASLGGCLIAAWLAWRLIREARAVNPRP